LIREALELGGIAAASQGQRVELGMGGSKVLDFVARVGIRTLVCRTRRTGGCHVEGSALAQEGHGHRERGGIGRERLLEEERVGDLLLRAQAAEQRVHARITGDPANALQELLGDIEGAARVLECLGASAGGHHQLRERHERFGHARMSGTQLVLAQ
jgi:hypothetical protein